MISDYSGKFLPNLKLGDFSAETIAQLFKLYSKLFMALDGFWYLTLKERAGNEEALDCDIQAWERFCRYEMAEITSQLNIRGNDVVTLMKAMQISPSLWNCRYKIEVKNRNKATLTVIHCPTLDALEKEGEGRENEICSIVEPKVFRCYASFFNSNIEVKCLKSPSRKSRNEICCKWEFSRVGLE